MSEAAFPKLGEPIPSVRGRAVVVPGDDVDTDRIIPARFMKCVTFDGLGAYAFHDERFDEAGASRGHPLDDPRFTGASVLVAGANFGCGSSREHAPQALFRFGLRAVIASSFAEIFFGNCTTLGLVCARVSEADLRAIGAKVAADPTVEVTIDVASATVRVGEATFPMTQPASAREALLTGRWDPLATLRARQADVEVTAARLPYTKWTPHA